MGTFRENWSNRHNPREGYEFIPTGKAMKHPHQVLFGMDIDLDDPRQVGLLGDYLQNELYDEWYEVGVLLSSYALNVPSNFELIGGDKFIYLKLEYPFFIRFYLADIGYRYSLVLDRITEYERYKLTFHQYHTKCSTDYKLLFDLVKRRKMDMKATTFNYIKERADVRESKQVTDELHTTDMEET